MKWKVLGAKKMPNGMTKDDFLSGRTHPMNVGTYENIHPVPYH